MGNANLGMRLELGMGWTGNRECCPGNGWTGNGIGMGWKWRMPSWEWRVLDPGNGVSRESGNAVSGFRMSWELGMLCQDRSVLGAGIVIRGSGNAVSGTGCPGNSECHPGNGKCCEAVRLARQKERELSERGERCNASVLELWERCKPCLRQRCLRFYSRTCRSGAALVGRQLEEFLNHSSPISIWVDGERLDSLLERDERQERQLEDLEERFGILEEGIDGIYRDSSLPHGGFQQLFQPLFHMTQRMLEGAHGSRPGIPAESRNFSDDRMVCQEIRRNSAGCLRMRDECEQCREILALDCGQEDPSQQELREQLEDAVRVAERFTRRYDSLLREFQEEMLNTSGLLDQLNRQFGWVSRLANYSLGPEGFLQVTTVSAQEPSAPPDTQVTVQLFDSEPLELTVPGDVPWDHPKFMDIVAEQALQRFKENAV
uniref:Clusterin n=1 Tax=Ficedula albicollis TaxID=59894 RepID=U3JI22_FICAL